MTQHPLKRRRQIVRPDKITLPVVHLGASLKPENNDIDELWTYSPAPSPLYSKTSPKSDKDTQTPVPKSPKHKNIFELSNAYKTSLPLNKGYWKIPGLSTNLIGFHSNKESLSKTVSKEKDVYERKFRNWYNNCLHGSPGRLPPIQIRGVRQKTFTTPQRQRRRSIFLGRSMFLVLLNVFLGVKFTCLKFILTALDAKSVGAFIQARSSLRTIYRGMKNLPCVANRRI